MLKFIFWLLFAPIAVNAYHTGGSAEIILSGDNEYRAVRLIPEIYRFTNSNLSDILVVDENGANLPFFIHTHGKQEYTPEFSIRQDGRNTIIKLHGMRNVRISELTIHTESRFRRNVTFANGRRAELYNLVFDFAEEKNLTLDFGGYSSDSWSHMEIVIYNQDNAPIDIYNITLTYFADEVVFAAGTATSATLLFGNRLAAQPPVFDIANYRELVLYAGAELMQLGRIIFHEAYELPAVEAPEPQDLSFVFNIVITTVAFLLGVVILVHVKRKRI